MDLKKYIKTTIETKTNILEDENIIDTINKIVEVIAQAYKNNNKVLTAGNGGSACDAQHIAGELVSRFFKDRAPLNALSLTSNTPLLTSIGNDYSFEDVYARQIQGYATKGDVFIALSTSGNSKNIVKAIEEAKKKNVITIGLVGKKECDMDRICDYLIKIPSEITPIIQESHIMICHIICAMVEEKIFG